MSRGTYAPVDLTEESTRPEQEHTPILAGASTVVNAETVFDIDDDSEAEDHAPLQDIKSSPAKPAKITVPSNDGVFANMAAKPESMQRPSGAAPGYPGNISPESPPPYAAAEQDAVPPYFETIFLTQNGQTDSDPLVNGLAVGSPVVFGLTMLVSMSFGFIGFLIAFILSSTHAGKHGSMAGFGISLVQYGLIIRSRPSTTSYDYVDNEGHVYTAYAPDSTEDDDVHRDAFRFWFSYLLMLWGWFIVIRSSANYVRAKKLQKIIMTAPAEVTVV